MWDALVDINMQLILAGIFGGVVRTIRVRKLGPREVVSYIVAGGLLANYCTTRLLSFLSAPPDVAGFTAFLIGYGAFRICLFADRFMAKQFQQFERPEND